MAHRWTGLITWWQSLGRLAQALPDQPDLLNLDRPDVATPLPRTGPLGASPEKVEDAVQEFLTDWLVRKKYDQALEFLSPRSYACLNLNEDARGQALDAPVRVVNCAAIMEYANSKLGTHGSLTSVVGAFHATRSKTGRDRPRVQT